MKIDIGIGDLMVSKAPAILGTRGLGSCVGVTLYDRCKKIGALAHIMLPYYSELQDKNVSESLKFRYADYAIPYMINKMNDLGSRKYDIVAKIIGGASMFRRKSSALDIGNKNVDAVRKILKTNFINIKSEEIGGDMGRTVFLDLSNGTVMIKIYGKVRQEFEI